MTLVSTKYIVSPAVIHTSKIGVVTYVWDVHQHFRERLSLRFAQSFRQDFPMLCFGAAAMSSGPLSQALDQRFVHVSNQKICHASPPDINCYQ
jgi:hypothetical protein